MALVKTNRRKVAELATDDLRRVFKRSLEGFLKENDDELEEKPSKDEQAEIITDLTAIWQDAVETMVDAAVAQYCDFLFDPPEDEADSEEDEAEDED